MPDSENRVVFDHPKDINRGAARVIWIEEGVASPRQSGWALPGGRRTTDVVEAAAMADTIDRITRAGGSHVGVPR